jgi:general secretion pathway protein G
MKDYRMKRVRRKKGFTLVEVLLVLAILVVLGSLVTVSIVQVQKSSNVKTAISQIKMLESAVILYRVEIGQMPEALEDLRTLPQGLKNQDKWRPFIDKSLPIDPWGNDYQYQVIENGDKCLISSYGPDKNEGGNDDITNE